jgi:hypothetical protein
MTYRTEMMIRRGLAIVVGAAGLAWMAWDSYVLYQILLAVSR